MRALRRTHRISSRRNVGASRRAIPILALASILYLAATAAGAQESQNYRMDRLTIVAGGTTAASQSYTLRAVFGQETPDGAASACGVGTVSGFGFWSVLGARTAPIVLMVSPGASDPQDVQLSWSGVEALFQVYRDSAPDGLLDPQNLHGETAACGLAVDEMASGDIVYYRVVAAPQALSQGRDQ